MYNCASFLLERECVKCNYETHLKVMLRRHEQAQCRFILPMFEKPFSADRGHFTTFSKLVYFRNNCKFLKRVSRYYDCHICNLRTTDVAKYDDHRIEMHAASDTRFKCKHCKLKFRYQTNLRKHQRAVHADAKELNQVFLCDYCDFRSLIKRNLDLHVVTRHTQDQSIRWFNCNRCSKAFKAQEQLTGHVKEHRMGRIDPLKCDHCHDLFLFNAHLERHILSKHNIENQSMLLTKNKSHCEKPRKLPPKDKLVRMKCEICQYRTYYKNAFRRHLSTKHNVTEEEQKTK